MQVSNEGKFDVSERNLLIIFGTVMITGIALMIFTCARFTRRQRVNEEQNKEYANWTIVDDIPESFKQLEVRTTYRNPLHIAIRVKNLPLVQELVEKKIQSCTHRDLQGNYALHHAARSGSIEMVRYIAGHTPADFRPAGRSPLHAAAERSDLKILSYLIQKFPEMQMNKAWGKSYLHTLCVDYTGMDYPRPGLRNEWKLIEFIHVHKPLIPNELFTGTLLPFKDFNREASSIEMTSLEDPLLV